MRILSIVNQKGGVGKTTTAVNLATALTAVGKKVLLLDLDPQGNASTGLGIPSHERELTSYDALLDPEDLIRAVRPTAIGKLKLVPATIDLSGAELELTAMPRREFRLQDALSRLDGYDYVLIDCPPSLGLLTINALVASHAVLIPVQCEFYALEGLSHLMRTVEMIKQRLNPELAVQGIVLTMHDRRNKLSEQIETDVREVMGELVYKTLVPRNVRVSEAPSYGKPVLIYDLKCPGSQAYLSLAREVIRREKQRNKLAA